MADFVIRPCVAGDEIAINAGFNRVFGLHRSLAEWQWKYQEEPEGRWIIIAVDAADGCSPTTRRYPCACGSGS